MLLTATDAERDAILRAMCVVAAAGGRDTLTPADETAIRAANEFVFGSQATVDVRGLAPISPRELAAALDNPDTAEAAAKFLAVTALVDGTIDASRIELACAFAGELGVKDDYLRDLTEAAAGHLAWVAADLNRQNVLSLTHGTIRRFEDYPLHPYRENGGDRDLVERYRALAELAPGTLGREFLDWYTTHSFELPGEPESVNEAFVRPHDSTHLLSGYSTSPQGELLVSTFTLGMMGPHEPIGGQVLPVILSFHLGVHLTDLAGAWRGSLDPRKFWAAWDRGAACSTNLFAADWDFWSVADVPLAELRRRYRVPPLPADLAASDDAIPA